MHSNEDKMDISLAYGHVAKEPLEAIGNLHNNDVRIVTASTATNSTLTASVPTLGLKQSLGGDSHL